MAKIKLGARPVNFKRIVKFKDVDGSALSIEISYIYRTRKQFGEFLDAMVDQVNAGAATQAAAIVSAAAAEPAAPGATAAPAAVDYMTSVMTSNVDANANYILKCADGWNLDAEFTLDNVKQLCDEYPGAAVAIMGTYQQAISEGHSGN